MKRLSLLFAVMVVTGCCSVPGGTNEHFYAGAPASSNAYTVVTNKGYVAAYNETTKSPAWVCYRLFKVDSLEAPERPSGFKIDKRTKSKVSTSQYTGSGYDRGHMAPNYGIAICYGEDAQRETFLMSNVTPQTPNLNRGPWKALEQQVAKDWAQRLGEVWVTTGPIQDSDAEEIGDGIEIPTGCFKIVIDEHEGKPRASVFVMGQNIPKSAEPTNYTATVDFVEKITGLDFFRQLPDPLEKSLESEKTKEW